MNSVLNLEIVKGCNHSCFYCHVTKEVSFMPLSKAKSIISNYTLIKPKNVLRIYFQGYGEPTLYPYLEELVLFIRENLPKAIIVIVTNGKKTINYNLFDEVDFSCDSHMVTDSGKYLSVFESKLKSIKAKVVFRSVNYGQDLSKLKNFCLKNNYGHIISGLNKNTGFDKLYPVESPKYGSSSLYCSFNSDFRLYTVDGVCLPCCYFNDKEISSFISIEDIKENLYKGTPKAPCIGCKHIK